jgi:ketosteroid isomerase-like protein
MLFGRRRIGKLSGRDVIEADYADHVFRYHSNNLSTKFDKVDAVGKDVRATGTWSCTFQHDFGHTKHVKGQAAWILVHEGDTWKIREDTYDQSSPSPGE